MNSTSIGEAYVHWLAQQLSLVSIKSTASWSLALEDGYAFNIWDVSGYRSTDGQWVQPVKLRWTLNATCRLSPHINKSLLPETRTQTERSLSARRSLAFCVRGQKEDPRKQLWQQPPVESEE